MLRKGNESLRREARLGGLLRMTLVELATGVWPTTSATLDLDSLDDPRFDRPAGGLDGIPAWLAPAVGPCLADEAPVDVLEALFDAAEGRHDTAPGPRR